MNLDLSRRFMKLLLFFCINNEMTEFADSTPHILGTLIVGFSSEVAHLVYCCPCFNISCSCQGPLSSTFPIENRISRATMRALKTHLDRAKSLPLVKRISDFHLLLFVAQFLDVSSDVPALAECVRLQSPVPEGYALLIESMANTC